MKFVVSILFSAEDVEINASGRVVKVATPEPLFPSYSHGEGTFERELRGGFESSSHIYVSLNYGGFLVTTTPRLLLPLSIR